MILTLLKFITALIELIVQFFKMKGNIDVGGESDSGDDSDFTRDYRRRDTRKKKLPYRRDPEDDDDDGEEGFFEFDD